MDKYFSYHFQADDKACSRWLLHERGSIQADGDILTVAGGWATAEDINAEHFILEFSARAAKDTPQVQIWAGFRHFSRDFRYVAALRGGSNNHLYLARLGAEGYDKMLALRPLEWEPQPGVWYHFRIVCHGAAISIYIDDFSQPLLTAIDEEAPFSSGSISLGGSYLPAQFKEVRLTSIPADYPAAADAKPDYLESVTPSSNEREQMRLRRRAAYHPFAIPALPEERLTLSLNGDWLFIPDYEIGDAADAACAKLSFSDSFAHTIKVPSCWIPLQAWLEGENMGKMNKGMNDNYLVEEMTRCLNQTFDYKKTKSAWYRHYLDFPAGIEKKHVILDFEGIALISTIYFNGVLVHENVGMFAPMQIDVSHLAKEGRNILAIKVERRLTKESEHAVKTSTVDDNYAIAWDILDAEIKDKKLETKCERREFCTDDIAHGFYSNNPGGIWRNVYLIISSKAYVEECYFRPSLTDAQVQVCYANEDTQSAELTLSYSLAHKTTGEILCGGLVETAVLEAGQKRTTDFSTPKVSPRLWGPGTPNLYLLTFTLCQNGNVIDTFTEQVGFRSVAFKGQTLMYNGKPMWVRGGNHMPAHVRPNDQLLARRFLSLALEHNLMATRTHVAPWSSVWLDAADEMGVMVSFEGTWSWLMLEHIPSEQSIILWKKELIQLMKRHRNRPSLFLMTMNNEMKFYLHDAPDEIVTEKGRILEGGIRAARAVMPHLPLVCDSAYFRKHAVRTGRYEHIIQANGYDDGDMDDPHGYFGWYNPCFFHFMNGEFGRDYATPGRPCMSQECATGYPRAEDGLPARAYLFMHQTPQTTVGKKAYEYNDPAFFLKRHAMLTKELAEMFRRVEHERTCGVLLFAFETWFYHQHDAGRIQPMRSAKQLKMAYQPVLASVELWGRHYYAGETLEADVTLINDSMEYEALKKPSVEISLLAGEELLASDTLSFETLPYFHTAAKHLSLPLPSALPQERQECALVAKVCSEGKLVSKNEYELLLAAREWALGPEYCGGNFHYLQSDENSRSLLARYGISGTSIQSLSELENIPSSDRVLISGSFPSEDAAALRAFALSGGKVILLGQRALPAGLLGDIEASFTEHRQEIITMNIPESPVFDGIEPLDTAWFGDGRRVPYVANGRYSLDRFRQDICVLAETLEWHGYINKPTDYRQFGGSALFSVKMGEGNILVSSLRTDAGGIDPVASRLTGNIIKANYIDGGF